MSRREEGKEKHEKRTASAIFLAAVLLLAGCKSASQVRAAETVTRFEHVRPDGRDRFYWTQMFIRK